MKSNQIKIGTPVIYWGVISEKGERSYPFKTTIESEPWELGGGETVCKVAGKRGGVSIKHLDEVTAGSLMAARLQGLKEVSDDDIQSASQSYFDKLGLDVKVTVTH
jgi:hypothetical protein